MAFDGAGNFSRSYNWVADRDNGVKIQAARMDAEFDNYAVGLNATLLRNGVVAMAGNFKMGGFAVTGLGDGSVGSPALQFSASSNTGVYSPAIGVLALTAAGVERLRVNSTGAAVTGALAVSGAVSVGGLLQTILSAVGGAGLNIPHGAAPTAPVDGDVWTTTAGLYARINGVTVGPFAPATTLFTDSAGLRALLSDETGTGVAVFNTSPTLVTPILGTPASGNLANCSGYPISSGTVTTALGYTPMNAASYNNVENKSSATIRSELTQANMDTAAGSRVSRVASGTAANSGKWSWGTAAPGTLAEGEFYAQYDP